MKPIPREPYAPQARMMDAIIGDIMDTGSPTFARLDALREVSKQTKEGRVLPNKRAADIK